MEAKDLTQMKLSELRELYPEIVTNSKKIFLEKIEELKNDPTATSIDLGAEHEPLPGNDAESIAEARHVMQITDNIPPYILAHLYVIQGCECTADAYAKFMDTQFKISRQFQLAMIKWYKELFKENIRRSSCNSCWVRRVNRFRKHLRTKID